MAAFIALSSFSPLASPFVPAAEAAGGPKAAPRRASTHVTKHKPTEYWVNLLEEAGVPCGPINTIDKTFADPDCPMSYAYWNPALVRQQRLLNPQTGEFDEVRVERLPDGVIPVNGRDVEATRWRLTATPPAIQAILLEIARRFVCDSASRNGFKVSDKSTNSSEVIAGIPIPPAPSR